MTKKNLEIRNEILENNLRLWQVGAALGLNDRQFLKIDS